MNLYVAAHAHKIAGIPQEKNDQLLETLLKQITQEKYCTSVAWHDVGDMTIWDYTCVLHRAGGGTFAGKYRRDLRRTTVHDACLTAWGLNDLKASKRPGLNTGSLDDVAVNVLAHGAQPVAL